MSHSLHFHVSLKYGLGLNTRFSKVDGNIGFTVEKRTLVLLLLKFPVCLQICLRVENDPGGRGSTEEDRGKSILLMAVLAICLSEMF